MAERPGEMVEEWVEVEGLNAVESVRDFQSRGRSVMERLNPADWTVLMSSWATFCRDMEEQHIMNRYIPTEIQRRRSLHSCKTHS